MALLAIEAVSPAVGKPCQRHRVRTAPDVNLDALCIALVNSPTFAWAEVCGRSYGGGVLELEPSEAESLVVRYRFAEALDADHIDSRLRAGDLDAALDYGDDVLLRDGLGLSRKDILRARAGWMHLRQSRQSRRRRVRNRSATG